MRSLFWRLRTRVLREVPRRALPVSRRPHLVRLGSQYGGWIVPAGLFSKASICWCAVAGEDITFDLALIDRFGCHTWGSIPQPAP